MQDGWRIRANYNQAPIQPELIRRSLWSYTEDGGKSQYSCAPVSIDSVSAVSVIRGLPQPEKNLQIKQINLS
jgi:hypothetical protein